MGPFLSQVIEEYAPVIPPFKSLSITKSLASDIVTRTVCCNTVALHAVLQLHLQNEVQSPYYADYSTMDNEAWEKCPSTTNAIECRNTGCKQKQPIPLKMAMISFYILDEAVSAKHVAA